MHPAVEFVEHQKGLMREQGLTEKDAFAEAQRVFEKKEMQRRAEHMIAAELVREVGQAVSDMVVEGLHAAAAIRRWTVHCDDGVCDA